MTESALTDGQMFEQPSEQGRLLRRAAMDLLARREHSRHELFTKLRQRCDCDDRELLDAVLDRLEQDQLLSDQRFAESFVRSRISRGHGPVRIRQELQHKGVTSELCQLVLEEADVDWFELAHDCRERRFGYAVVTDAKGKMKQMRYLQYRGFTTDVINTVIRGRAVD